MTSATEIADELEKLCCAETEGAFFDYVTEAVGTICRMLRERDEAVADAASKSDQIGKLYRVCNERDVLKVALRKIADLRYFEEANEPFDEALDLADAALAQVAR